MKAVSLWQPWATLVVGGYKAVETRSWSTTYRGPLLIHAAKRWGPDQVRLSHGQPFLAAITRAVGGVYKLPRGAIVGLVDLVACVPTSRVSLWDQNCRPDFDAAGELLIGPREAAFGDYSPGRFAWILRDPTAFDTPIPYVGARMLFDATIEVSSP